MNQQKEIILRPKKDEFLKRFHPWVFSGAISSNTNNLSEGDLVNVISFEKEFLAKGHYQVGSIAVRILSFEDETINENFYEKRIASAYKMRNELKLIRPDNNVYRLIHGEGDNLPGLIIDIYGSTAVVQSHSVGMHTDQKFIAEALKRVFKNNPDFNIYYKSEGTLPFKADIDFGDTYIYGNKNESQIAIENGLKFKID